MNNSTFFPQNDYRYLAHHGVKGMRWGHRKQQYEAKRKAKYMKKYGITSKQYDSVREKSLSRHTKGTKIRNVVRGVKAATTTAYGLSLAAGSAGTNQMFNNLTGESGGTAETFIGGVLGTAAVVGIRDLATKAEWAIGRRIVDSVMETSEFEDMARRNANKH